ncbi:hypothetical protein AB0M48_12305 [Lentzea sp. NPDC051208]
MTIDRFTAVVRRVEHQRIIEACEQHDGQLAACLVDENWRTSFEAL